MSKSILILSSLGKCGIAQYSINLQSALKSRGYNVDVHDINTPELLTLARNYDIMIVEYENAIIKRMDWLTDTCKQLKKTTDLKIFVTPHSEKQHMEYFFGGIDSFIYHKNPTLQLNIPYTVIPMGVPLFEPEMDRLAYRNQYGLSQSNIVLSTIGFMFGWKRHAQFIDLIAPWLRNNKHMVVQLLTSHHTLNPRETETQDRYIKNAIERHSIHRQVIHLTQWIDQKELSERLYMSDLGFLYAGIESTSSSASLKEFVTARLPVVRTNSNHYHDVVSGCLVTSKELNEFVRTCADLSTNNERLDILRQEMVDTYAEMNYNNTVDKFIAVFNK